MNPTLRLRSTRLTAAAALTAASLGALTPTMAGAAPSKSSTAVLEITATATGLRASTPSIAPGWTRVTLKNNGTQPHQASLVRLPKSTTAKAFMARFAASGERALAGTVSAGGPAIALPTAASSVTVDLPAGTYVALDMIPGVDGKPAAAKGFLTSFEVRGKASSAARPTAAATVELHDFLFKGDISLKRGTTLAIRNDGAQPHELVMFGLAPGKTANDVAAFLADPAPAGPPPFTVATGLAGIAPKATGYLTVDVPAGRYAFLCFLPDVTGKGEPHLLKGMVAEGDITG